MFEAYSEMFLEYVKVTRSEGTYEFYKRFTKPLNEFFISTAIEDIDHKQIIEYITFHKNRNPNITNSTLNKHILTLKLIVEYNINKKIKFKKLRETQKVMNTIPQTTISKIFKHLKSRKLNERESFRNYVIFRLLLDTGLRLTEIINLKFSDIDMKSMTIHVKITKTNSERYVFFSEVTRDALKELLSKYPPHQYVFENYQNQTKLSVNSIQTTCKRLKETLNIKEGITPHKWRHTFADNFLRRGGNLETLRLILGHTSLTTTQRYLHLDREALSKEYFKVTNPYMGKKI